ncbi:uncharacterized protein UTRI_00854 [Ustilago trichophora]|uniref:SMP-LTD domain-containing protein n=1 Tax=Ustilago trichophora TaxID=86804 RepID=A0A5C3DVG2_9BASI|nr:uncharacterized protein UTRI_00854 [Ustilago trichophora]
MLREVFYYLLGGVTFLPLCLVGLVLHFYFNAPSVRPSGPPSIDADIELTHEKKLAALDLAARNAAIHAEIEKAKGKDQPQGDATVPPTAKRLGPGPANSSSPKPFSSGWLTVRPTFDSDKDAATTASGASSPAAIPASLVDGESDSSRLQSEDEGTVADNSDAASIASIKSTATNAGPGYMSQMYRGILDYRIGRGANKKAATDASNARSTPGSTVSGATPTGTAGKEVFYCILKSPILYLYSSDDTASPNTECHAAIDLRGKRVSLFVAGLGDTLGELEPETANHRGATTDDEQLGDAAVDSEAFDPKKAWKKAKRAVVRDGELFMKRNAIRIVGSALGRSSSPGDRRAGRASNLNRRRPQWFIFCKNNYFMEDWYHALLQASLMPDSSLSTKLSDEAPLDPLARLFGKLDDPIGPTFSQEDMASLLVSLDSLPDPLPLRWLNALVGRIFFSVYRTAWLEDYIVSKMMKKLHRVKTPGFLGDIKVEEVDVGRRAPGFSRPMLKALTSEGEASMEIAVHYVGEVRITISTTLTLSLGSRFKPYTIPIVLAVVLRSLEGNLLLHVKRPPSNRLWFGFTTMPKMEIDIEPVVSERKVQWGMVTRLIESRLRELLNESIVVPNMDDLSFFDTRSLPLRGGIFADAAKKVDVLRTEVNASSASAGTTAPVTASAQQERDAKRISNTIKTSDLLAANKVGAASAPVSGTATPVTPDRASASTTREAAADEDGEASSISANAPSNNALRNRKAGLEASTTLKESSLQSARTSSPAAAGLSDLLNRDLAAGGGSVLSGSPPRQDVQASKRRTWFGSGPKSSVSSIGSSSGLSSLGLGAAGLGGRSAREQSSLALGNASIERPSQRSHSASVSSKNEAGLSIPGEASTRAVSDSASSKSSVNPFGEPSSGSVASVRSPSVLPPNGSDLDIRNAQDAPRTSALAAAALQREASREAKEGNQASATGRSTGMPSLIVSSASEPVLALGDVDSSVATSHEARSTLEAPSLNDGDDERDFVDSPSSLAPSTRSSLRSSRSDAVDPDGKKEAQSDGHGSVQRGSAEAFNDLDFIAASRQTSRDSEGTQKSAGSAAASQKAMPPPPPPRRPAGTPNDNRSVPRQDAASALSSVQRSRYGLNEGDRSVGEGPNALTGSTSAMLLTSWNKAKASMADKESRQAAARDAKDAIKRGWASWNSKRAEAKRGTHAEDDMGEQYGQDGMNRSHSSRLSLVPGKSAWLASSPPDPTSFGLGFDKSSPEDTRSGFRDKHASAGYHAGMRSNLTDTDDDNASIHSNSSNRQPYRELRASKKVHGFDSGLTDGRASSVSSSKLASTASLSTTPSTVSAGDASSWSAKWDAEIPSLTPPAPAYREEEVGTESKRKALERTVSSEAPAGLAPPALPQRKPSSSISSTGQSGGVVSFIPPAPAATIKLASPSSLSVGDIEPAKYEAGPEAQSAAVSGKFAAPSNNTIPSEPSTPERSQVRQADSLSSSAEAQTPSPVVPENAVKSASEVAESDKIEKISDATPVPSEPIRTTVNKNTVNPAHETDATESSPADNTAAKTEQPYAAIPSPEVSSPSLGSGIKKQPGRATMMAVPGIPSMQKAGPQSFSAPPPPESTPASKSDAETSPSAFRASSLFKIPTFGSPVLTPGGSKTATNVSSPSKSTETALSASASTSPESSSKQEAVKVPPPVPARPAAGAKAEEADNVAEAESPGIALGLTQMDSSEGLAGLMDKSSSKQSSQPRQHGAKEIVKPAFESTLADGEAKDDATFAEVAKAEGPAADPEFEHAQLDAGDTVQIGDKEAKIPTFTDIETRTSTYSSM